MPKTAKDKILLAGDVSKDLAELVLSRAKGLGWSKSKFVSHIFKFWEDLGAPGVHPNDYGWMPPEDWVSKRSVEATNDFFEGLTLSEDPPPAAESIERFSQGDRQRALVAQLVTSALEKKPESIPNLLVFLEALAESPILREISEEKGEKT